MLSTTNVIASATIGAAVAVAAIVTERHLRDQSETDKLQQAYSHGWYEGQAAALKETLAPTDPVRNGLRVAS